MKKKLEFVCTGNLGRSPVAELSARNYLREAGLDSEYEAISSGTLVAVIKKKLPQNLTGMTPVVRTAMERGDMYSAEEASRIEEALREGNEEVLRPYFAKAAHTFETEETTFRREVLPEFGLNPDMIKNGRDQTVAGGDRVAVFAIDQPNLSKVQGVYAGTGYNPIIDVMSAYVTGDSRAEVPNAFGKGRDAYRAAVRSIVEHVPMAVRKVVSAR